VTAAPHHPVAPSMPEPSPAPAKPVEPAPTPTPTPEPAPAGAAVVMEGRLSPGVSRAQAGTRLVFSGRGLQAGEQVAVWVTEESSGQSRALSGTVVSRHGELSVVVDTTGWASGSYTLALQGLSSGASRSAALTID
jgi:eukaryotic-like serine/threonine-protein kinase